MLSDKYIRNYKIELYSFIIIYPHLIVLFSSTKFVIFRLIGSIKNKTSCIQNVSLNNRMRFFVSILFYRGRSPPSNLKFQIKNFRLEENKMEGNHPKRRRDKYNPYYICEREGHYYITFQDGQGVLHEFEISRPLYGAFNDFELKDISYLHKWDKHIEHSEVWEVALNDRALIQSESVEDIVLKNILKEKLHRAIRTLPLIQRRRLILYFYEGLTYEKIAEKEGCSKMSVKRSVDAAIGKLKKILKK